MAVVAVCLEEEHRYTVLIEDNAFKQQRLTDLRLLKGDRIIADFDDPTVALLVKTRGCRPSQVLPFESRIASVHVQQGQDEVVSLSLSTRLPEPVDVGLRHRPAVR